MRQLFEKHATSNAAHHSKGLFLASTLGLNYRGGGILIELSPPKVQSSVREFRIYYRNKKNFFFHRFYIEQKLVNVCFPVEFIYQTKHTFRKHLFTGALKTRTHWGAPIFCYSGWKTRYEELKEAGYRPIF